MAWTSDQLAALEEAISLGALSVKYADRTVEYRSLDDMMRLRERMRNDLGLTSGTTRRYFETAKGL